MHRVDVIEDIEIMYGYENIKALPITSFTIGETYDIVPFINAAREACAGLGYQEILSPILSNKKHLYGNMNAKDTGTVEIEQCMSETYSVVRTWLLPMLMEVLSKNKHVDYPQKIFEQGPATTRQETKIQDSEKIALSSSHTSADFTEMKQALDSLMNYLGLAYSLKETSHTSFIDGRVGEIIVNGRKAGIIGEIHPQVLANWNLETPVSAMELNLSEMFEAVNKK